MSARSLTSVSAAERSSIRQRSLSVPVVALLCGLFPVVGLLYVLFASYGALTERVYARANGVTGELIGRHSVGQSFVARYDGLSGVSLWLGTYSSAARAGAVLHLRHAPDGPDIATVRVPASEIRGANPWQAFSFPHIENSQGQPFYVKVESPGAAQGKALTLFWWERHGEGDTYPSGTAYIDGKPQRADLAFSLRYSPSPVGAWAQAARAFSGNAPPLLVLLLGTLLLVAIIVPILKIRAGGQSSNPGAILSVLSKPWVLPVVLCAAFAHGLLYALLIPAWQGPDEFGHFAYAALLDHHNLDNQAVQQLDWQGKDRDGPLIDAIGQSLNRNGFTKYVAGYSEQGAPITPDAASVYAELRQPVAYYWLCAATMQAAGRFGLHVDPYTDADAALRLMRLVSLVLSLGVVGLAWLAGRLLAAPQGLRAWLPLLLPLTVTLLPMRAFADSIANNDVLAELAVSALVVALIALLRWPRGSRGLLMAALLVTLAAVSSGTKSSALAAVAPLTGLGLVAWICLLLSRPDKKTKDEGRRTKTAIALRPSSFVLRPTDKKARVRGVAIGAGLVCAIALTAFFVAPMLYRPLGSATGWKLGNRPIEKAPVNHSESAHAGRYVLSLVNGLSTSQQVELTMPHPALQLSVSGYARLYIGNGAPSARAVIRLEAANTPSTRADVKVNPSNGWAPFSVTLRVPADAQAATVRLFAREGTVEFDDFSLASDGIAPVAALLNPSFEQQEVALAKPIARFLPQEAQWIAEVAANPQTFDKGGLWGYYAGAQFQSFWGNFGWVSLPLPDGWFLFWLVVSALTLLGLLWKLISSADVWDWRDWLCVVFVVGFGLAVVFGFARQTMLLSVFGVEAYPQGRYLFVLSIPVAWMLVSGVSVWTSIFAQLTEQVSARFAGKLELPQLGGWLPAWAWVSLLMGFAAFALTALVAPYYYG